MHCTKNVGEVGVSQFIISIWSMIFRSKCFFNFVRLLFSAIASSLVQNRFILVKLKCFYCHRCTIELFRWSLMVWETRAPRGKFHPERPCLVQNFIAFLLWAKVPLSHCASEKLWTLNSPCSKLVRLVVMWWKHI